MINKSHESRRERGEAREKIEKHGLLCYEGKPTSKSRRYLRILCTGLINKASRGRVWLSPFWQFFLGTGNKGLKVGSLTINGIISTSICSLKNSLSASDFWRYWLLCW